MIKFNVGLVVKFVNLSEFLNQSSLPKIVDYGNFYDLLVTAILLFLE